MVTEIGPEWTVEWAALTPSGDGHLGNLVLTREQAVAYGDELVQSLRIDDAVLREQDIDPEEPFVWRVEAGELLTKQISRKSFERVAESDRHDALAASQTLEHRARMRLHDSRL